MNQQLFDWIAVYRSGTGKRVEIVVKALNAANAGHQVRMEMAKRFRGKTYKTIQPPMRINP